MHYWKWLYPGMGVKRWLLLLAVGVLLISAGLAIMAGVEFLGAAERAFVRWIGMAVDSFPPAAVPAVAVIIIGTGVGLMALGLRRTIGSLLEVVLPDNVDNLANLIYRRQHLRRGPRVVAIGGGTGLSTLLRGLKTVTSNITAIVTVADDGGSSGRLRAEMGMPPPGDVRNTLVALADTEPLMERLFQYRFDTGSGLKGHSFGNLFLAAMTAITGDFERAVRESSKVLAVRGQVLPSTLESVTLVAEFADGTRARGESQVAQTGKRIRRVYLSPPDARPLADALRALREADIVILGPGSLYTSVLPNLLVPGIAETIGNSRAMRVYVCNVMSQPGETDGYRASDHVRALLEHAGSGIVDYVLMNSGRVPSNVEEKYRREGAHPVQADVQAVRDLGVVPVCRYLLSHSDFARHDPHRLAAAIRDMWETHRAASRARPVRTACRPAAGRRRQGR